MYVESQSSSSISSIKFESLFQPAALDDLLSRISSSVSDLIELSPPGAAALPDAQNPFVGPSEAFILGAGDTNVVDFDDVSQGGLANCYLMSAMAGMARENPNSIRNLIQENRDASGEVTSYTVTLHQRDGAGALKPVQVDVDASEFGAKAANPGDSDGATREIWPMIIEKAYAQLHGSYESIGNGGSPEYALEVLMGKEANGYAPTDFSFQQVQTALFLNQPVNVITPNAAGDDPKAKLLGEEGLAGWHCYTVVDARIGDDGRQMVKLYNPWGNREENQPGAAREADGGWVAWDDLVNKGLINNVTVGATTGLPFTNIFWG